MSNWNNIETELKAGGKQERAKFVSLVDNGNTILRILSEPYIRYAHWIPSAKCGVDCLVNDCPICKANKEAKANGAQPIYSSSKKFIMYVYNRLNDSVELWDIGKTVMSQVFNEMGDRKDEGKSHNPLDFDLKIRKSATGTTIKAQDATLDASVLEKLATFKPINEVTLKLTAEQIIQLMEGKTVKDLFAKENEGTDSNDNGEVVLG